MRFALPEPANDDFKPTSCDAVARYFATRGLRRGATTLAVFFAAAIVAATLMNGAQS